MSNWRLPPLASEICIEAGCYLLVNHVNVRNHNWHDSRNQLTVLTTSSSFNKAKFVAAAKNLLGYGKATENVHVVSVTPQSYQTNKSRFAPELIVTDTAEIEHELNELNHEIEMNLISLNEAGLQCAVFSAACIGGFSQSAKKASVWGAVLSLGACGAGAYQCNMAVDAASKHTHWLLKKIAKRRAEVEAQQRASEAANGGNGGGGGGGRDVVPTPGNPAPFLPSPQPSEPIRTRIEITIFPPIPDHVDNCQNGPCTLDR